jgi:glycosyltransferase involved in cell wall biosynthesis
MKIAFVQQPFGGVIQPGKHGDSLSVLVWELARRLAVSCEVIVYDRRLPDQPETETVEKVQYRRLSPAYQEDLLVRGLKRLSRFRDPRRPLFASRWFQRSHIGPIARDLRRQRCDFVVVENMPQYPSIIRKFNPATRIALHMHCEWLNQLDRRMISRQLQSVDLILGVSNYITRRARAALPEHAARCQTLLNGCDASRFQPVGRNGSGPKRLLFLARLTPEKGVHVLIEAFRLIADRYPEAELDIVGPESVTPPSFVTAISDNPATRDLARWHGTSYLASLKQAVAPALAERIHFWGQVTHEESANYYANAYAYVHPSVWDEPMALPLFEATAAGLPVIATSTGGTPEVVLHGETGLLVPANDPRAFADAISQLLDNPDLCRRMSEAGREWAVSKLSWDRASNDLLRYLHELA